MSKKIYKMYKQCKISRGQAHYTAWIPVDLAKIGQIIIPKNKEPATIKEVYNSITLTHKQLIEYYQIDRYGEEIIY